MNKLKDIQSYITKEKEGQMISLIDLVNLKERKVIEKISKEQKEKIKSKDIFYRLNMFLLAFCELLKDEENFNINLQINFENLIDIMIENNLL